MKFFRKNYMLFLIAISLVVMPVGYVSAKTASQKNTYTNSKNHSVKKHKRKKVSYKRARAKARKARLQLRRLALAKQKAIDLGEHYDGSVAPQLASSIALVVNQNTGEVKYAKNANISSPIASITKLMTAMVVLDAQQPLDEIIFIADEDVDTIKGTRSRLPVRSSLHRSDMLQLALMSSENRAAFALASNYPGGRSAFVKAMNAKALSLGLMNTHFAEPTGLMYQNISTAEDLYSLVAAAYQYPEIRAATTTTSYEVYIDGNEGPSKFRNTNSLVRAGEMDIGLSKTGYITEAGRCLVMQTVMAGEPVIVVLLDAAGTNKRTGDVNRVRKWIEYDHVAEETVVAKKDATLQPKLVMSDSIYEN
ncbi:MAG: D-alanyl-D-alanine endopeptidase [Methylophilaceae bacterium]